MSMERHEQDREINQLYIVPKKKFNTIFEEYIDKQKQFQHLRSAVNTQNDDTLKQELETAKNKLETLKKI